MELRDAVRARRMVRAYDGRPVAPRVLRELLDLAVRAPSAGGAQGRDLLVLREPEDRARFWAATADDVDAPDRWLAGMMTAPVLVLCLAEPGAYRRRYAEADKRTGARAADRDPDAWDVPWWDVDTGMAALLLLLGAVDAGLGACFFGVPPGRVDAVRDAFAVPSDRRVVGAVGLGHPAPAAAAGGDRTDGRRRPRRPRRPLAEVAHEGRFGRPLDAAGTAADGTVTAGP
ncbi:nitroreductase family protein [Quadrisphaera sp. DSM 44207]|uniref:nitroreductase family protein n=1 Tax=Quadrisphaera sp. DSM 44207 TaxID=1881057 RepID=UPI000B89D3ED|nr:nitroreductase family protein [Quadrisphaera sp. DSM 44207]